jgi:hypothetical protein
MAKVPFLAVARDFSLLYNIQTSSGTHSASYPTGTRDFFHGGKTAEVQSYTSISPYIFMVWWLIMDSDITFTFKLVIDQWAKN